ncbi:MAG: DUF4026 domain-containing protein, partial [Bacteroidales bacterium]|nr:DUF4026 domain-containing protein [Bacteroidales bacterium]
ASKVAPSPDYMFTIHAVNDSEEGTDSVWLHTHGLTRCGTIELEILGADLDNWQELGNALNQIAKEHSCSLSQLALKWVLKDSDLTSVLIGASRPSQIIDNAGIVGIAPLSEEELAEIERVVGA